MRATAISAIALTVAGTISGAAPLRITSVRAWPLGDVTRVVIEANREFAFRSERLHNPERVFFDIQGARPHIEGKRFFSQAVEDKLLKRLRVAETAPGVTRVVLDLNGPVEFTASRMSNPHRLILELRPGTEPAPAVQPETAAAPAPEAKPTAVKPAPPPPTPAETAKGAARLSSGKSSMTRALGLKINRVVIDPGHGGHDQGTVGRRGLMEKDLVLDLAQRLGKLIQERMGSEVIYTRTEDVFVPLEGRTALANEKKADLFVSLHANSSPVSRIAGVETFYLNFTTARDALDVAARENASSQKSISELQDVLKKISLQEKIEESRELAGRVQTALYANSARYVSGARNRGVKKAPFMVLVGARMPAVLVEIGFLSNLREEALLKRPEHRQRVAEALYRGLSRYADGLSHYQVAKKDN
ncbi:MAG: N-acetylmuramoyl-L-alanine amidase [Acidobacteria bacterium]|nr:N-acetylmuramoyl-L-alanine amidase [Acidobacteriota bacterium]